MEPDPFFPQKENSGLATTVLGIVDSSHCIRKKFIWKYYLECYVNLNSHLFCEST